MISSGLASRSEQDRSAAKATLVPISTHCLDKRKPKIPAPPPPPGLGGWSLSILVPSISHQLGQAYDSCSLCDFKIKGHIPTHILSALLCSPAGHKKLSGYMTTFGRDAKDTDTPIWPGSIIRMSPIQVFIEMIGLSMLYEN